MLTTLIPKKQNELADVIRILIYKEDASILTKLNLEDDQIFIEPLLMAYFNRTQVAEKVFPDGMLPELMQGYLTDMQQLNVHAICNTEGIGYVPTIGYLKKGEATPFEKLHFIPDTTIEVVKYRVPLLRNILGIVSMNDPIKEEELIMNEALFTQNISSLTTAITHLRNSIPNHFSLIQMCLKKCVFYQLKDRFSRSFASINANGCLFITIPNGKEKEDEIYFINEVGKLTGKIMHTSLFHNQQEMFKIDHRTRASEVIEDEEDRRNVYTLFNNLFMNVSAMMCLESCITSNIFTNEQQQDAKTRLALYLKKYEVDIKKMEAIIAHFGDLKSVFVEDGVKIYNFMTTNAETITKTHSELLSVFDFTGFFYRMEYSDFSMRNS
ncbi:hypothetical protein [uncultured Kordia sp.]|uniref:hypothetical protein n=1 Tax=uncultured Kordia sp. TaxID=507699 RepID=UPI0026296C30|nr:hypothetical protein [uncultured Kordia sp.]